jgi:hypothetical protein
MKLGRTTTYDTSWVGFSLLVWTTVELQLGIICACAPSLRAFFRRYLSSMFSRPSVNGGGHSKSRSRTTDTFNHHPIDSHQNDSQTRQSKGHDIFDKTNSIDMQVLTRRSLEDGCGANNGEQLPPATYQPDATLKALEAHHRTEPVRWNSNSTLGVVQDRTAEEATRWYSNSTNGEHQRAAEPLPQNRDPRAAGNWPMSPDSEVSGGLLKPQSVRSAV